MDLSQQLNIGNRRRDNSAFVLNINNSNNNNNSSNNNNSFNNNNNQQNINNYVKSFLTSPVAAINNSLRVVHQKQSINSNLNLNSNSMMMMAAAAVAAAASGQSPSSSSSSSASTTTNPMTLATAIMSNNNNNDNNSINYNTNNINVNNNSRIPSVLSDSNNLLPSNITTILADRYVLLNQISGSSFYECVDVRTGDALICKAIGNSYTKILSAYFRLDGDPHIKPLHKLLQGSNQTYLLLPPSQYGDLHSYVRERKRLREPEARLLFRQICETVKSCHEQGIVLRDLKLRKFVFSDRNRTHLKFESLEDAVVLDDPDDDILKEKIGCPAYVAPEILKPNSDFSGKAADLWSLGVILYTMLVGRYPFNDPEHSSLFAKISRCQFTIPDFLSPKARCLIKSLLQKIPKNRITSDDVLYHPWLQDTNSNIYLSNTNNYNCNLNTTNSNPSSGNSSSSSSSSSSNINYSSYSSYSSDIHSDDQRVPELDTFDFT